MKKYFFVIAILLLLNYCSSQKMDSLFINNYPCNQIENNSREGLWLEVDTSSMNLYNFSYYTKSKKSGLCYSFSKELKPTQTYFIEKGDTLFYCDYIKSYEYCKIDTSKVYSIDFLWKNSFFSEDEIKFIKPMSLSSSIQGFSSDCSNGKERIHVHVFYKELSCVFITNKSSKLNGKMLLFNSGQLSQIINFQDGLIHGEVIYYKNNIEVKKIIYCYGVMIYPNKISKKSLVNGYFIYGDFFPYSQNPTYFHNYLSGYYGLTLSKKEKFVPASFDKKSKINNIFEE